MADIADRANDLVEADLARRVAAARGDIPQGVAGECGLCGEEHPRLIGGNCPQCRDKHGLP
jgi:hypothetical protein